MLMNLRAAYGEALLALAGENKNVVALDADLCGSTQSVVVEKNYPERYFEMGIGEQNMISVAAGLALTGKIPFAHSFSVFATGRPFDDLHVEVRAAVSRISATAPRTSRSRTLPRCASFRT